MFYLSGWNVLFLGLLKFASHYDKETWQAWEIYFLGLMIYRVPTKILSHTHPWWPFQADRRCLTLANTISVIIKTGNIEKRSRLVHHCHCTKIKNLRVGWRKSGGLNKTGHMTYTTVPFYTHFVSYSQWKITLTWAYGVMEANCVWSSSNWISSGDFLAASATPLM